MPLRSIISRGCGTTASTKRMRPFSPPELIRLPTLASFRDRLQAALPNFSVVGPVRAPLGFCALKE
jgi:hypothetical protein